MDLSKRVAWLHTCSSGISPPAAWGHGDGGDGLHSENPASHGARGCAPPWAPRSKACPFGSPVAQGQGRGGCGWMEVFDG